MELSGAWETFAVGVREPSASAVGVAAPISLGLVGLPVRPGVPLGLRLVQRLGCGARPERGVVVADPVGLVDRLGAPALRADVLRELPPRPDDVEVQPVPAVAVAVEAGELVGWDACLLADSQLVAGAPELFRSKGMVDPARCRLVTPM